MGYRVQYQVFRPPTARPVAPRMVGTAPATIRMMPIGPQDGDAEHEAQDQQNDAQDDRGGSFPVADPNGATLPGRHDHPEGNGHSVIRSDLHGTPPSGNSSVRYPRTAQVRGGSQPWALHDVPNRAWLRRRCAGTRRPLSMSRESSSSSTSRTRAIPSAGLWLTVLGDPGWEGDPTH
jgi:hypothetical protein